MMSYVIRDESVVKLMEVPNSIAQAIISKSKGYFRERLSQKGTKQVCFELTQDYTVNILVGDGVDVYLWKGSVLIPKD